MDRSRWGLFLFIFALILLLTGYWLSGFIPQKFEVNFIKKIFSFIGIIAGLIALLLGYTSYPRVHNLKIFLNGYLTGIVVLAYFLLGPSGFFSFSITDYFVPGLYFMMFFVILLSITVPSFMKYRHVKRITIAAIIMEAVIIYIFRTDFLELNFLNSLRNLSVLNWETFIPWIFIVLLLFLSLYVIKNQFYLGGMFAGMTVLFGGGWYLGELSQYIYFFDSYIFAAGPFFLAVGIFTHWLTRIEHRALYDPMLRIYNRNYCEKVLSEQTHIDTSPPFGVAIIDIDHFKKVNDQYGHRAGDEVLINISRILTNELVPGGILCRYGGEEFVIFFPDKKSKEIKSMIERVRKIIKKSVTRHGRNKIRVTISAGISHRKKASQGLVKVLKTADKALYRAKNKGRNQVRYSRVS